MTFISYAQNNEDATIFRALPEVDCGFYVDVGSNHPSQDSVTNAFYQRGWNGINIEPLTRMVSLLNQERPRDLNLQVLAGGSEGSMEFYEIADGSGLSTSNRRFADNFCLENRVELKSYQVPVVTLTRILEKANFKEIHFLKIDVEGSEKEVLVGLDLRRFRPWIIVVEANLPCSQIANHADWEELITAGNYSFVWYDGLNRFYLANEQLHRRKYFTTPLSVFDNIVDSDLVDLRDKTMRCLVECNIPDAMNAAIELQKWAPRNPSGYCMQIERAVEILCEQLALSKDTRSPAENDCENAVSGVRQFDSVEQMGSNLDERTENANFLIRTTHDGKPTAKTVSINLVGESMVGRPTSKRNYGTLRQELNRFLSRQYRSVRKRAGFNSVIDEFKSGKF